MRIYRRNGGYEWHWVGAGSTPNLIGFVDVDTIYGIFRGDEPWIVHGGKYDNPAFSILNPNAPRPERKSNAAKLFDWNWLLD